MPFRLTIKGIRIECDTTDELAAALALGDGKGPRSGARSRRKSLEVSKNDESQGPPAPSAHEPPAPSAHEPPAPSAHEPPAPSAHEREAWSPPPDAEPFFEALPKNERAALALLATSDGEVTLEQLSRAAGFREKRAASLMMLRWKRLAEECEMIWSQLLSFRVTGTRKERVSLYKAGPNLKD
jgi:hypothetical protein